LDVFHSFVDSEIAKFERAVESPTSRRSAPPSVQDKVIDHLQSKGNSRTQEVHVYRNAKTNMLAAGMEDKVQLVTYAIGVTRVAEDVNNVDTRGWRLIELQKSASDYI